MEYTEKFEEPFHVKPRTDPPDRRVKQLRIEINVAEAVKRFAILTRRSESHAWEFLAARGLVAMGAIQDGPEKETA